MINMNEIMGLSWDNLKAKGKWMMKIYLPSKPPKSNHSEFFRILAKTKKVNYDWKHGLLYVTDPDNPQDADFRLGIRHKDFAKTANRATVTATSAEMILLLRLSGINVDVEDWEDYFFEEDLNKFLRFIDKIAISP